MGPPGEGDIYWEIIKPNGEIQTRLEPGQNDIYETYRADQAQVMGDPPIIYVLKLFIDYISENESSNLHLLHINHRGVNHTVHFNLNVTKGTTENEFAMITETYDRPVAKTETTALGWGVWIVVIIITLLIVLVAVYLVYKRRQAKKKRRNKRKPNQPNYTVVKQKEDDVNIMGDDVVD